MIRLWLLPMKTVVNMSTGKLASSPNVQSVRTMLTLKTVKSEPRVPLGEVPRALTVRVHGGLRVRVDAEPLR